MKSKGEGGTGTKYTRCLKIHTTAELSQTQVANFEYRCHIMLIVVIFPNQDYKYTAAVSISSSPTRLLNSYVGLWKEGQRPQLTVLRIQVKVYKIPASRVWVSWSLDGQNLIDVGTPHGSPLLLGQLCPVRTSPESRWFVHRYTAPDNYRKQEK